MCVIIFIIKLDQFAWKVGLYVMHDNGFIFINKTVAGVQLMPWLKYARDHLQPSGWPSSRAILT